MTTKLSPTGSFPMEDTGVVRRLNSQTGGPNGARVGGRIAAARKNRGLNRNQLARKIGTSWALVDRWEKGRTVPNVESLARIAAVLHVSTDDLLGRDEPTQGAMTSELVKFQRHHAPADLTEAELRWLSFCPVEPGLFGAEDFARLLDWFRYQRAKASERLRKG